MMLDKLLVINLIMVLSIIITCLIGDKLVERARSGTWLKALMDNITHGIVGLLATLIVLFNFKDRVTNNEFAIVAILGYCLSAAIDIDHFIEARSFHIHVSKLFIVCLSLFLDFITLQLE